MDGAPPAALQRRRKKFPVPLPELRDCPCWRNIGRRYPPGPRRSPRLRMPAQRNGLPPLRRAHIAQRYPPSPATLLDLVTRKGRATHARPGSVRPRQIAETKKPPPTNRGRRLGVEDTPAQRRAASLRNSERCAARRSSSGPCPSGRWRTVAWVRRIWRMKRRQCRHMSRWLRTASCPRKSSCPSRKSLDRATSSLQLSIGRSPRNAPGWRRPSGGRDAAAPEHWKA